MTDAGRGQADIARLLAFILGVTALLVVVPFVLGLAGIDIRDGSVGNSGVADDELEDGSLIVLSTHGTEINDERTSVGVVEVLVAASGEDVNLDDVTVTWRGADTYELAPDYIGTADASFGVETFQEGTTLGADGEKAVFRFDLGSADVDNAQRFGDRLEPGDTVTIRVTTGQGAETSTTVRVPDPLPPGSAVRFV
jgi:archaellin